MEENSDDSVEEPEEEQEKDDIGSIFEEKGEVEDDKPPMIHGARYAKKWGMISKYSTGTMSSSSWIGENPKPMSRTPLSMPYYVYGEADFEGLTYSV